MRGDPVYAAPVRRDTPSVGAPHGSLTEVELTWIEGRLEQWIRFGRVAAERILSRSTKVAAFRPGATFAFVRWTSNDYGTVHSSIAIMTAVEPGSPFATLPFVRRSEEHTSELQSLMRNSYAVFCLKKKKQ